MKIDAYDISVLLKKLECDENYELDIINKYFDESKRYLENIEFKILPKKNLPNFQMVKKVVKYG